MKLFCVFAAISLVDASCIQWIPFTDLEDWVEVLADKTLMNAYVEARKNFDNFYNEEGRIKNQFLVQYNGVEENSPEVMAALAKTNTAKEEREVAKDEAVKSAKKKREELGLDSQMAPLCGFGRLERFPYIHALRTGSVVCCDKTAESDLFDFLMSQARSKENIETGKPNRI